MINLLIIGPQKVYKQSSNFLYPIDVKSLRCINIYAQPKSVARRRQPSTGQSKKLSIHDVDEALQQQELLQTDSADRGNVTPAHEIKSAKQQQEQQVLDVIAKCGLSQNVSSRLLEKIKSKSKYSDLLDIDVLKQRLDGVAQLKNISQRIDLNQIVQQYPSYITQDSDSALQAIISCVTELSNKQALGVDWVALLQTYPPMFAQPAAKLLGMVEGVNKVFQKVLGIEDYGLGMLLNHAHSQHHLSVLAPRRGGMQGYLTQLEKSLQHLKAGLGEAQATTIVQHVPAMDLLDSKEGLRHLKLLTTNLGDARAARMLSARPQLLSLSFSSMRETLAYLISYFHKTEGFPPEYVKELICHSPAALHSRVGRGAITRYKKLKTVVANAPEWVDQMRSWSPAQRAHALNISKDTLDMVQSVCNDLPGGAQRYNLLAVLRDPTYHQKLVQSNRSDAAMENTLESLISAMERSPMAQEMLRYPEVLKQRFASYMRHFTAQQIYQMVVVRGAMVILYIPERVLLEKLSNYRLIFSRLGGKLHQQEDLATRILTQEPRLFSMDTEDVNKTIMELHRLLYNFYGQSGYAMRAVVANPSLLLLKIDEVLLRMQTLSSQVRDVPAWQDEMTSWHAHRFGAMITLDSRALRRPGAVKVAAGDELESVVQQTGLASLLGLSEGTFANRYPAAKKLLDLQLQKGGLQDEAPEAGV